MEYVDLALGQKKNNSLFMGEEFWTVKEFKRVMWENRSVCELRTRQLRVTCILHPEGQAMSSWISEGQFSKGQTEKAVQGAGM